VLRTGIASHTGTVTNWVKIVKKQQKAERCAELGSDDATNLLTIGQTRHQFEKLQEVFKEDRPEHNVPFRNLPWSDRMMTSPGGELGKKIESWYVPIPLVEQIRAVTGLSALKEFENLHSEVTIGMNLARPAVPHHSLFRQTVSRKRNQGRSSSRST